MPASTRTPQVTIARTEWAWLWGAILVGSLLRLGFPGRMAIEHFDEGVYASNFWFGAEEGYEYPARFLYAPPLLPMGIEWTMIAASLCGIRPTGWIPILPSLVAGLATIPSLWWVGRRWFGPTAGIVAAWLVATSDFHSSYSRAALTDVPLCLFLIWAVYFSWQSLVEGTRRSSFLAALFTGLAWWTKYNGWLPLAIALSGGIAWHLFRPSSDRSFSSLLKRWGAVTALTLLIWSPVLMGLQKHGGYAPVAANHRQYLVGFAGWPASAARQLTNLGTYDNWLGAVVEAFRGPVSPEAPQSSGPPVAGQEIDSDPGSGDRLAVPTSVWLLRLATPCLMAAFSLISLVVWIRRHKSDPVGLAGWLTLAWICGLSLTTPCYHPYPRLTLPWLTAVWMGVGLAVELLAARLNLRFARGENAVGWRPGHLEILLAAWLMICITIRCVNGSEFAWSDRSEISTMARHIAMLVKKQAVRQKYSEDQAIVYVFGEPALVFELKACGLLVGPVQDLQFLSRPSPYPTFLVRTDRAKRSSLFQSQWSPGQFEYVASVRIVESHLVQFDEHAATETPAVPRSTWIHLDQVR